MPVARRNAGSATVGIQAMRLPATNPENRTSAKLAGKASHGESVRLASA